MPKLKGFESGKTKKTIKKKKKRMTNKKRQMGIK